MSFEVVVTSFECLAKILGTEIRSWQCWGDHVHAHLRLHPGTSFQWPLHSEKGQYSLLQLLQVIVHALLPQWSKLGHFQTKNDLMKEQSRKAKDPGAPCRIFTAAWRVTAWGVEWVCSKGDAMGVLMWGGPLGVAQVLHQYLKVSFDLYIYIWCIMMYNVYTYVCVCVFVWGSHDRTRIVTTSWVQPRSQRLRISPWRAAKLSRIGVVTSRPSAHRLFYSSGYVVSLWFRWPATSWTEVRPTCSATFLRTNVRNVKMSQVWWTWNRALARTG